MTTDTALPRATATRWQPLRLGLVDLFYYDDEQFWFHDGRLLLRGNNGTGKSKVLALTLPFLLDGSLAAARVEPDADPKKRMDWNLLLGGAHPHSERLGYTWIEFGRRDADGTEHFTTLGCGLKAVAGRGIARHWFFVTDRRVGDLHLVDSSRVVLTRERLQDELEGRGRVYDTREEYRRAVDETLFGLGTHRYNALVDLLIQLRQPHLSKRPDERALSGALTEALAPLDQAVIADVAESFRSLEEDRDRLQEAEATHEAARTFLTHYVAYARVASRRSAAVVRGAQSEYEQVGRDQIAVEQQHAAAQAELDRVSADEDARTLQRSTLRGRDEALRTSPEMDAARELTRAGEEAAAAQRLAHHTEADLTTARTRLTTATDDVNRAESEAHELNAEADRALADAAQRAQAAELASVHEAALADQKIGETALARRRDQLEHVTSLVTAAEQARTTAEHLRSDVDNAQARTAQREELVRQADRAVEETADAYARELRAYLGSLEHLEVEDPESVLALSADWALRPDGAAPARHSVQRAAQATMQRIDSTRARAALEETQVQSLLDVAREELGELERGRTPEPPSSATRDPRARVGAPGAPLWRLTDFIDGIGGAARAGIEAALEAAGLLDAWVRPDGSVTDVEGDVLLGLEAPVLERSLVGVLTVSVDRPGADVPGTEHAGTEHAGAEEVSDAVVHAVLERIGWTEESGATVWVDPRGRFGLGPARGAWSKPEARYVGAGARESSRREAVRELRERIDVHERDLALVRATLHALAEERDLSDAEHDRYPDATERQVLHAHADARAAAGELERAKESEHEAHERWHTAALTAQEAREHAVEVAQDLHAATTLEGLRQGGEDLQAYASALRLARGAQASSRRAEHTLAAARARRMEATAEHDDRRERERAVAEALAGATARLETLRGTVGQSVAELEAALQQIREELEALEEDVKRLARRRDAATDQRGQARGRLKDLVLARSEGARRRDGAIAALRRFVDTQLLRIAVPHTAVPDSDAAWTTTSAVALAREVESVLTDVSSDQDAWTTAQGRASSALTELGSQMSRHGHTAVSELREEGMTVRIHFQARQLGVDELVEYLREDIEARTQVLSAREREILENHLVTDVAGHLSELLARAQNQVGELNRELSGRKTSTGMQLRVQWRPRPDGPTGLAVARDLLLRSDAAWTAQDRSAIGDFLQGQIAAARISDPTAGWAEQLRMALDYRSWHDFAVERHQNGQWRPATGPASGGERVLTVSVPLFAAASSHYHSAGNPYAPRLILLDEAFAGVDDDSRAKSLGLLATFDLDVVMTSEREWGCYPQVPGLAIAQLSRVEGIDAVGVTRWRWDGRDRTLDDEPGADAVASAPGERVDDAETSLFD